MKLPVAIQFITNYNYKTEINYWNEEERKSQIRLFTFACNYCHKCQSLIRGDVRSNYELPLKDTPNTESKRWLSGVETTKNCKLSDQQQQKCLTIKKPLLQSTLFIVIVESRREVYDFMNDLTKPGVCVKMRNEAELNVQLRSQTARPPHYYDF